MRNVCERMTVLNDSNVINEHLLKRLKIVPSMREKTKARAEEDLDSVYTRLQPKKKKQDLAKELGVSRTTLWRMAKRQRELEQKQGGKTE